MFHMLYIKFHPPRCFRSERPSCFLCFKNPSLGYSSFKNGPCFRKYDIPFPIGVMKVNELIKGDVDLEMFTNMEMIIQVAS